MWMWICGNVMNSYEHNYLYIVLKPLLSDSYSETTHAYPGHMVQPVLGIACTWLVYSPHWAPPPLCIVLGSGLSALVPGTRMKTIQRAVHMLGGLAWKGRGDTEVMVVCYCAPTCL